MSLYLLIPLASCITSAVLASAILARDAGNRSNRLAGAMIGGVSIWALCEVLWNTRADPETARIFLRLSAVGWVFIGPLALNILVEITGEATDRTKRLLPFTYVVSGAFIAAAWFTPWMHARLVPTGWGWGYETGWLHPVYLVFTTSCIGAGVACGMRAYPTASPGEKAQVSLVSIGMLVPIVVASVTDSLLPLFGFQPPRLGSASMTVLGAVIAWGIYRYGYSLLAPGAFAAEILETLPNGVAMLRVDGRIRSANSAMARMLGTAPADLVGVSFRDLLVGSDLDVTEEATEVECQLCLGGDRRVSVSLSTTVLCDRQHSPIGVVLVARDVGEVVALRGRLVVSDRLAAVGELAAGIAHEINNPLAYVRSNLSMMRRQWDELKNEVDRVSGSERLDHLLAETEEMIDESLQGVDRAVSIIRDVKGLSHAAQCEPELANVNELLDGVIRMASSQLGTGAVIRRDYADLPALRCAPQELQQVFLNLVMNAGYAISGDGEIAVVTRAVDERIEVRIEDDGCGIPPAEVGRIFDPFFTTKAVGEGTGLGLGIALEIVRGQGGEILVESEPGAGTVFCVHLPTHIDRMGPRTQT
ncbi:MAG: ATP-binding protein [Myxococcota bacterium]